MRTRWVVLLIAGFYNLEAGNTNAEILGGGVVANGGGRMSGGDYIVTGTVGQALIGAATTGPPLENRVCSGWWCVEEGKLVSAPEPRNAGRLDFGLPHPNPSNGDVALSFALPQESRVDITIMDVTGRRIRTLSAGRRDAGGHSVSWNGRDEGGFAVESGVYFVRFRVDGQDVARKRLVVTR